MRRLRVALAGVVLAVGATAGFPGFVPAFGETPAGTVVRAVSIADSPLDKETFAACEVAKDPKRFRSSAAARSLAKRFASSNSPAAKKHAKFIRSSGPSKKQLRYTFVSTRVWCSNHDAYRTVFLTVGGGSLRYTVADATRASISGTATPGAKVRIVGRGSVTTAAEDGTFGFTIDGLVLGSNPVTIHARAPLHYPATMSGVIEVVESEDGFKASAEPAPFDVLVNATGLQGHNIHSSGQVTQVDGSGLAVTDAISDTEPSWDAIVCLYYPDDWLSGSRDVFVLDTIEYWGTVTSPANGRPNTCTRVEVKYLTVVQQG